MSKASGQPPMSDSILAPANQPPGTPGPVPEPATGTPGLGHRTLGRSDALALGLLVVLTLAFFWKIALTNRVLAGLDVFAYFYPYRDFVSEALRSGNLPLWNPYLFMGAPLLANSQAAVLYPLHWPLIWLSTPKQIAWSIVIHIWLAGTGAYLFARLALRLRPLAASMTSIIFALGGFLSAQVEHVNQLNASAWLPWLLLCLEGAMARGRRRWLALLAGGAVVGLILLAGHTQAAYIVLFGAAVYAVVRRWQEPTRPRWRSALRGLAELMAMVMIGMLLAAGQLLPTLELSRLSVRSGGLAYIEAASFSLKPTLIFKAFIPPLVWDPPFSEYVAYVGLTGLVLAALGAWVVLPRKQRAAGHVLHTTILHGRIMGLFALLGIFLAFGAYNPGYYVLYKLVPGFNLFRVPARWLLLYAFGAAMLAGAGLEALPRLRSWRIEAGIALLLVMELFLAGQRLAYNDPTAPAAFDSMRTAPSHLLADNEPEPFRFLSISDIRYDPGDLGELQAMYSPQLPEEAVHDLIVATKMKEVLAFNLPLRYRLSSVDGYDGGLLPVRRYVALERLFLAEEDIWPDGRLRQQLRRVPPARLLSLLNVKYVITDKTQDVWINDVFYDLEHTVPLGQVTLTDLPDFAATHLGVVSYLTGTADLVDATPVAHVTITDTTGSVLTTTLRAGEHTAEGMYTIGPVRHQQAQVGHQWRDDELGNDYIAVLGLERTLKPAAISVRSLIPGEQIHLRGVTLIDDLNGTSRTLSVDPAYKLVHSGDVKVYENLSVLPRAFTVRRARVVTEDETALEILADPSFDPTEEAVLAEGEALASVAKASDVDLISYEPQRIQLQVSLDAPAYLILTDSAYPGWKAEVDGQAVPIVRADLYFRAVALDAGEHQVAFQYQPTGARLGLGIGMASWFAWAALIALAACNTGRKPPTDV